MQLIRLALLFLAAGVPSIFQMRLVLDAPSADSERMAFKSIDGQGTTLFVRKAPFLDETAVQSAAVTRDPSTGEPVLEITFTPQGRERFAQATGELVHKRIAIVIEGKLLDAPIIQAKISAAAVPIHGHFTEEEATRLAETINVAVTRK